MKAKDNVNVTLAGSDWFAKEPFPCPVCGESLPLRAARTGKPYCHCDTCGVQLFFRGKPGIRRLKELLASGVFGSGASQAIVLYNRLLQLKTQKERLEAQQGIIFRDPDLDQVIDAVEGEAENVRRQLAGLSGTHRRDHE